MIDDGIHGCAAAALCDTIVVISPLRNNKEDSEDRRQSEKYGTELLHTWLVPYNIRRNLSGEEN